MSLVMAALMSQGKAQDDLMVTQVAMKHNKIPCCNQNVCAGEGSGGEVLWRLAAGGAAGSGAQCLRGAGAADAGAHGAAAGCPGRTCLYAGLLPARGRLPRCARLRHHQVLPPWAHVLLTDILCSFGSCLIKVLHRLCILCKARECMFSVQDSFSRRVSWPESTLARSNYSAPHL